VTSRTKRRQSGRGTSTWTRADERAFRDTIAALTLARRSEIDTLVRKIMRQESAIAARRRRHGIEPAGHVRDRVELLPAALLLIRAGALMSQSDSGRTQAIRSWMSAVQV
jgi:hypothetical protein